MSLEQSFSKKLTLGPTGSHQDRAISPSSTDSSPKSSPSKSAKLSLKGFGSSVRCRSPIRRQQTLATSSTSTTPSVPVTTTTTNTGSLGRQEKLSKIKKVSEKDKDKVGSKDKDLGASCPSTSVRDLGESWIPGTSGPPGVDNYCPYESQGKQPGVANKIIHNWKSACGRTKDKTKDLFKRWKTLPENHPDFDQIPGAGDSPPGSTTNICTAVAAVSLSQPSEYAREAGGPLGSATGLGRLKNLAKKQSEASESFPQAQSSSGGFFSKSSGTGGGGSGNTTAPVSNGPCQDMDTSMQINGTKSTTGWSVHVWGK